MWREARNPEKTGSIVFRTKVSLQNFGITHGMEEGQLVQVGEDSEVNFLTFWSVDRLLPAPMYRPDINLAVVKAFCQIRD